mmetsp:Transcript_1491/g.3273  ORF Transcript_1491/g.3273 Transcript_1491/m.3273 type:complete len:156 (+) Transcript_1491:1-468(+)
MVACPFPSEKQRRDILMAVSKTMCIAEDVRTASETSSSVLEDIAKQTAGYSGADLSALMSEAQLIAAQAVVIGNACAPQNTFDGESEISHNVEMEPPAITRDNLLQSAAKSRPSLSTKERTRLNRIYNQFASSMQGGAGANTGSDIASAKRVSLA